ncbi:MAG: hypothetical protein NTY72_14745 [Bacteroidetes bacterium]|nr:hypothetical protein [Bacteroidota bacterium]
MCKKILIITSHYPPSNLAGVHRARLFAQHLLGFGWEPIILTVDEQFYEENLDWNLVKLLPTEQRIEKVNAFKITKPRLIGDIGLRAFFQLRKRAIEIIVKEKIDFIYIPIPSFYIALLGPYLNKKTGVNYGIDYIDPWVHIFPGSDKIFSRHWFTTQIAKLLEPIAVKNASLITGVADGYYQGVIARNPHLKNTCVFGSMPYGGEVLDHEMAIKLNLAPYLFQKNSKCQLVYAGAMLPKAYDLLEIIFSEISKHNTEFEQIEFHFIGTGRTPNDLNGFNIKPLAQKYGLWETIVYEYPQRIPYLEVLIHLNVADAIFVLGSTEPHYSPSKVYQAVLSKKNVYAVLHRESTAVNVIENSGEGYVLKFDLEAGIEKIRENFIKSFFAFISNNAELVYSNVSKNYFNEFSAKAVTKKLTDLLDCLF